MDYAHFRTLWIEALKRSGLIWEKAYVDEQLDLTSMDRLYKVVIPYHFRDIPSHLFYITAELSWRWDTLLSARFATTEEEMLTELFGRKHPVHTDLPLLRVDVVLHASVQRYGFYPMPLSSVWRDWAAMVTSEVESYFPLFTNDDPKKPAVVSWLEEPEIQLNCSPGGQLYLLGVSLAAAELIRLPRQWDHPQRRRDPEPGAQIDELLRRVVHGLEAWRDALDELMTTRDNG
jgi:hypothetical protein